MIDALRAWGEGGEAMAQFVGFDVSMKETTICVVDDAGATVWEGRRASDPGALAAALARHAPEAVRVALETGPASTWLWHELKARGVPVVCIDARHANAALQMRPNKSDRSDARGLAEIVRMGWYREVRVKSLEAQRTRVLINTRARLVRVRHELMNQIKAVLMAYGLPLPSARGRRFDDAVVAAIAGRDWLGPVLLPLVEVWRSTLEQTDRLDKALMAMARARADCRRLMTVPGVGAITALTFAAAVDDPGRFARSSSLGAYLGLAPRRYQSGEVDRSGRISRCGDAQLRAYLNEAALVLLFRVRRWCALK